MEFVGTNLSAWATPAGGVLYLLALATLARAVWRSPRALWAGPVEAPAPAAATA